MNSMNSMNSRSIVMAKSNNMSASSSSMNISLNKSFNKENTIQKEQEGGRMSS